MPVARGSTGRVLRHSVRAAPLQPDKVRAPKDAALLRGAHTPHTRPVACGLRALTTRETRAVHSHSRLTARVNVAPHPRLQARGRTVLGRIVARERLDPITAGTEAALLIVAVTPALVCLGALLAAAVVILAHRRRRRAGRRRAHPRAAQQVLVLPAVAVVAAVPLLPRPTDRHRRLVVEDAPLGALLEERELVRLLRLHASARVLPGVRPRPDRHPLAGRPAAHVGVGTLVARTARRLAALPLRAPQRPVRAADALVAPVGARREVEPARRHLRPALEGALRARRGDRCLHGAGEAQVHSPAHGVLRHPLAGQPAAHLVVLGLVRAAALQR
eukprot:Rhum_TRINITY_DN15431_c4_g1::Rhum_TRINITY_DN15431_c4_g1_i5::g.157067::m.157067